MDHPRGGGLREKAPEGSGEWVNHIKNKKTPSEEVSL